MPSTKVQSGNASLGNTGVGTLAYAGAQTSGNCNVIKLLMFGGTASSDVTSVTQLGNTYTLRAFANDLSGGFGAATWVFVCDTIVSASAGSVVSVVFKTGAFVDAVYVEYPASGGVRTAHGDSEYGGTPVVPGATLTGATALDVCVGSCWDGNNALSTARTIGANAANLVEAHPDGWMVEDGAADGTSPMTLGFGTGATTDWWSSVALALKPSGGGPVTGTVAAALPEVSTALAGKGIDKGSASAALPKVKPALIGLVAATPSGTAGATLPRVALVASGIVTSKGSTSAALPKISPSLVGFVAAPPSGFASVALPKVSTALAGKGIDKGSANATLPKVKPTLVGFVAALPSGTASAALPRVSAALAGRATARGTISATLPSISVAIAGTVARCSGAISTVLPQIAVTCVGRIPQKGSISVAIPGIRCSLVGNIAGVFPTFNTNGFVRRERRIKMRRAR